MKTNSPDNHTRSLRSLVTLSFEEDGIEEDGRGHNQPLLLGRGILRKVAFEYIRVGKDLRRNALLDLEDLTRRLGTVVSILHVGGEDMEWGLEAASSKAGVALRAAVDAHTTAAGRLVHLVDGLSLGIVDLEARNAAVALLLDLKSNIASKV